MQGLTADLPKPMLPVRGKPILEHLLDRLRAAGYTDTLIVTGYRADVIENHFAGYPMNIEYRQQQVQNGTGSAALIAEGYVSGREPFLLTFGDVLSEPQCYREILDLLVKNECARMAIGVRVVDDPWQGAAVYESGGRVVRIVEKPPKGTSTTRLNSAGVFVFRPDVFDELRTLGLSVRGEYELTTVIERWVDGKDLVVPYVLSGFWRDIGRPEDLDFARSTL